MEFLGRLAYRFKSTGVFDALFAANFLLALHLFLIAYIGSSYISGFIDERYVGLVYMAGSALGLITFISITRVLHRFGNWRTLLALTVLEFLLFLGMAFAGTPTIAISLFILHFALYPLAIFTLDIFLENYTKQEESTGGIRGAFLTTTNAALIIAPMIAGFLLGDENYSRIFLIGALFLIPFSIIILFRFRSFEDPTYQGFSIRALTCIRAHPNLLHIFKAHFIMRLFFSWMVIYTPIYLHQHIGFDWPTIGIIFTVMLLPYLLIEFPAGKLADSKWGEKELLAIGFVITAFSVASMSFITEANMLLWMGVLFMTRVGASLLDIMTETYFFKHVNGDDANTISGFRMIRPLSYIAGPILAIISLFFVDIQYIFLILAVIILFGLRYALVLKDTK